MLLLLSITLPIILIYLIHKARTRPKTLVPPGPTPLPVIGNLHQVAAATNLHLYLWKLSENYGPIIHLKLGSLPTIVVSSAKLAKQVLKTQDSSFCSRPKFLGQQRLSYNGLDIVFAPYDEYWREVRKITSAHLFSPKKIQSFHPIREDEISRLVAKIAKPRSDCCFNLSEAAMALACTLICRSAFGKRYDEGGSEMRRFAGLLRETQAVAAAFYVSDYFPALGFLDRVAGLIGKLDETCERLDRFYEELIKEHLDRSSERVVEEEREDILDVLIKLKQDKSCSIQLNWDHIKGILLDIFAAGTDTSASSIVWIMTLLIKAPNVMVKLQKEIRNLIQTKGKVDEEDLPKLPYLIAVVNEALRLYPPVPMLVPRETTQRCTLEGYEIRPKTVVYVNAWVVARDPEYWENPGEFVPERFLNTNLDVRGQDFGVVPFGSGRRICPGMSMGLLNVELAVANLLYSFDWGLPPGIRAEDIDTDVLPGVTVHKKNPLLLVPKIYVAS